MPARRSTRAGSCPTAPSSSGPAGLNQLLLTKYRDDFVRTATEKLLTYALGRGVEYYDYPAIRSIDARSGARQLSNLVVDSRDREQHAVSDAEGVGLMINLNHALPRRTFLRGLGATLALPLLDSMAPRASALAAPATPIRLGYVYTPNGIIGACDKSPRPFMWTPKTAGANFEFSPTMKALEPFREQINVFSGLAQVTGRALGDGPGDHARATATFLTGVHPHKTGGADFHLGISADQIAAKELGKYTQLSSLELGLEPQPLAGNCDSGYTCAYMSMSWRGPTSPLPAEINPRTVFERLFGDGDSTDAAARIGQAGTPEERARLRHRQPVAAAHAARHRRQAQARGVSRGGPRHRAPHPAGRRAERDAAAAAASSGRARSRTTTSSTPS